MANQDETNTICECRYVPDENVQEMKDFNNIPNIHEIDEEESETEETTLERPNSSASDEEDDKAVQKETLDDESVYTSESFYSDESCDESKVTNVTPRSLNSSLIRVTDLQVNQSSEEQDIVSESTWKDDHQDESYSLSDEPSRAVTADKFVRSRRCRRWNMSFTDEEMRKIERENELLLRKIMAQQKPRHKILGENTVQSRTSSSAINRKKLQKKIENDNVVYIFRYRRNISKVDE